MEMFQTPRVNGSVLDQFVGRAVCVVGKVIDHQEGTDVAQLETTDGKAITVQIAPGSTWTSQYVEVIGHLHSTTNLQEFKSTDFGDTFDCASYNNAIKLMAGKYTHLFYQAQE